MGDNISRSAVFCTADIPQKTFESFIELSQECQLELLEQGGFDVRQFFVLMTSKDLSAIPRRALSPPAQPFSSPFMGETIDEIVAWFKENIYDHNVKGFKDCGFIILDSAEEEICTVVSLNVEPHEKVVCDFDVALSVLNLVNLGRCLDETGAECFKNSGVVMTKENEKIVLNGGRYLDGMEVKYDEYWRNFIREWSSY